MTTTTTIITTNWPAIYAQSECLLVCALTTFSPLLPLLLTFAPVCSSTKHSADDGADDDDGGGGAARDGGN